VHRYTPLRRRTRLRPKRSTPRRSDRQRDPSYLEEVRGLPCVLATTGECQGRIEADHAGWRPFGRKCSDDEAIPLCTLHHRQRTDYAGAFKGMTGETMRAWADSAIWRTRAALGWAA